MRRLALATAVAVALFAPVAFAGPVTLTHVATAGTAGPDGLLRAATIVGARYWLQRGRVACARDVLVFDAADRDTDAGGSAGSCAVWFTRADRDYAWGVYTDRNAPLASRRGVLADLCGDAAHEEGHGLGYEHSKHRWSVMFKRTGARHPPRVCVTWATSFKLTGPQRRVGDW